jgi:HD-like signal output (HDOD) protein
MTRSEQLVEERAGSLVAPSAVVATLRLLADPSHSRYELDQVLRVDAAFAADTLSRANSSWYSRSAVPGLATALSLLGERELSRIAIRASARCMQVPDVAGYGMANGGLWLRGLQTAVAAEMLADRTGLVEPSVGYTAGLLLLDVGKRLLGHELDDELDDAIEASESDEQCFTRVERSLLGCCHAEVGAALAESWLLAEELATAIRWHHAPEETESSLTWVCHVGDFLAMHLSGCGSVEGTSYRLNEQWSDVFTICEDELIGLLPVIAERAEQALGDLQRKAS